jgi:hypothetical protein
MKTLIVKARITFQFFFIASQIVKLSYLLAVSKKVLYESSSGYDLQSCSGFYTNILTIMYSKNMKKMYLVIINLSFLVNGF